MDLFVLGTILVVFLVLLAASLLVNKMPSGKTFEEVQAEKKMLADQMKQQSRPAKQKGGTQSGKAKTKTNLSAPAGTNAAIAAPAAKKGKANRGNAVKVEEVETPHVEFVSEEIILGDDMPVATKPLRVPGLASKSKKGSKSPASGILVNKTETSPASKTKEVDPESANHFEEIHPKDDVEMLRTNKDEPNKGGKPHKNALNELRKDKKVKTKAEKTKSAQVPLDIADIEGVEQIMKANEQKMLKRQVDAVDSVRGGNKRAGGRSDNGSQALQKLVDGTDEISVSVLIKLLGKAELSRSEIQLVIDYLLNKQSDSIGVINSEWSEGKQDMVQRLKKQLAEREAQLQNEQEAAAAIYDKLKLLRLELNQEKTQNGNTAKMYMWEMAQKEKDLELMMAKLNATAAEKATLLAQMQKMQVTLVQQKNAMGAQEEQQRELEMYKNTVQTGKVEMRNLENELDSARNEIIQLRQKSFEVTEQMNRDLQVLSGQVSTLKVEASNYEGLLLEKSSAQEHLEAEVTQLKGNEENLSQQLEELKQKNNDLRTKNWKLVEAVTAAERTSTSVKSAQNGATKIDEKELEGLVKERVAQAEKELKDKFTHLLTQISVFSNLKLENNGSITHSSGNSSSSNGEGSSNGAVDLDAWMGRVASELKKKLDVYESLLGTLRHQLQDKREKEIMSVGGGNQHLKSSTKFVSGADLAANGNAEKNGNGTNNKGEVNASPEGGDQTSSNGNGTAVVAAANT